MKKSKFKFDQKKFNLPEIEEMVMRYWKENDVFERSVKNRKGKKKFVFFEGPPYANGRPGIHHALARSYKDIILRYKTMAGFFVPRRAGWDTHGLPIELEAEKQLGLKNKREIEKIGISNFNDKARESIWKYKDEWEKMTERIGYFIDLKNAYITYEPKYIESLWWILKQIYKKGLLKESFKVVPYCPRCGTPLAAHELGMPGVYKKVSDPSIYIKFEIKNKPKNYFLVWTTTPWTLPANIFIALDPNLIYNKFQIGDEFYWSYSKPIGNEEKEIKLVETSLGKNLLGIEYKPLYYNNQFNSNEFYKTVPADFISTEEGTGFVHIAPAFGEDDYLLIQKLGIKKFPITVDDEGKMMEPYPGAGKFIKEADIDILDDLRSRHLLYLETKGEHEYPFCWRCSTPLMYFARNSWFIEVSRIKDDLIKANQKINWVPQYLKNGRFGSWLKEIRDWALSRERYWGTPLNLWKCQNCKHIESIGSLDELNNNLFNKNNFWIMRHAEAQANLKNLIASGPENKKVSKLTKKGILAAKKIAQKIQSKNIDVIYSSSYERTRMTAQIIGEYLGKKVIVDERLNEINTGVFNWKPIKNYRQYFSSPNLRFTLKPEGGETLIDVKKRVVNFIKDINQKYQNKNILIVSHDDVLRLLSAVAMNISDDDFFKKTKSFKFGEFRKINLRFPINDKGELDIHRPFVDEVSLRCPICGGEMKRVKEVADVWFDSGAMPFASWHYPFENKNKIDPPLSEAFPADYIAEGIDQTRGWFSTLLEISVLLGKGNPYKNVVSLGLILDKNGQKMSKSKGNVVNPWDMINKYGADTVRWYFYSSPAAEPKRFNEEDLNKILKNFVLILYNSFVFFDLYAVKLSNNKPVIANLLDKWIIERLNQTILNVTSGLDNYKINEASKEIEKFVDDLSRWYIRRSRSRFQQPISTKDLKDASSTLGFVLNNLVILMAPFMPFSSDFFYQAFFGKESIHLQNWPKINKKVNQKIIDEMNQVREICALALAQRALKSIKVRQPLESLKIKKNINKKFFDIIKDEVNVKNVIFDKNIKDEIELDLNITQELKQEGFLRELIRTIQDLRQKSNLKPKDKINLFIKIDNEEMKNVIKKNQKLICQKVNSKTINYSLDENKKGIIKKDVEINDLSLVIGIF